MARQEQAREDLLREATALVERIEIAFDDNRPHAVVGFRRDGAASIYFGEEPAYHFNARGELRRAYRDGQILKAERGCLVALARRGTETRIEMVGRLLSAEEAAVVIADLAARLTAFVQSLDASRFHGVGQVPATTDVLSRVRRLLNDLLAADIKIAQTPHAR